MASRISNQSEGQRVAWLLQRAYTSPKRSVKTRMGSEPLPSAYLLRRFAALNRTSRAHVTGLASSASAAVCICSRSASVIGISIAAVLRSLGFLGGLPRLVSMLINIYRKNVVSTIDLPNNSVHNKPRQKKTPMQPWRATLGRTRTGFRRFQPH